MCWQGAKRRVVRYFSALGSSVRVRPGRTVNYIFLQRSHLRTAINGNLIFNYIRLLPRDQTRSMSRFPIHRRPSFSTTIGYFPESRTRDTPHLFSSFSSPPFRVKSKSLCKSSGFPVSVIFPNKPQERRGALFLEFFGPSPS